MWKWMMNLVGGTTGEAVKQDTVKVPQLSREELSDLFSDILARPALHKQAKAVRGQARRFKAGSHPQPA